MKQRTLWSAILFFIASSLLSSNAFAQSPGTIVKPKNPVANFLNPNGDKYSSATTAGYTSTNEHSQSEIPYKTIPPVITENSTDVQNGPTGGFTDLVTAVDGSGLYAYYDGTNIMFRMRMGGINNGSKAYSILLDTDFKMGNSGPYADPNYIGPTAGGAAGNPGFEYEIVYYSHSGVTVYNVDGKTEGTVVSSVPLGVRDMISVAYSKTSGDADYFYDFGCPVTDIGSAGKIRIVASSIISPHPALKGKASDIYGIDDNTRGNLADAWKKIIDAQCGFAVTDIGFTGAGFCATCTNAPVITSVGSPGINRPVSGSWVSMDPSKPNTATISLYRNGTLVGTTTATSGMGWTITVPSVFSNDVYYAMAKATNESECLKSTPIRSGACGIPPASPTIGCFTDRGISGTIPLGGEVYIYEITGTNTITLLNQNLTYVDNATNRTFNYGGPNNSGSVCVGAAPDVNNGTYMLRTNVNGCLSAPVYYCFNGSTATPISTTTTTNAITFTAPVYNHHTSVSGTGATAGHILRLYINGEFESSQAAVAGGAFTFTNLSLKVGDELRIYAQAPTAGSCMTVSAAHIVTCYSQRPAIYTNSLGRIVNTQTKIDGTSPDKGATVSLYRGTPGSGVLVGTAIVNNNGIWEVTGLTLTGGETYYATTTVYCESAASEVATIVPPTIVCPVITGTYTDKSPSVSGTLSPAFTGKVRLYIDGAPIDSVDVVNATTWNIPVNIVPTNYIYTDGKLRVSAEGPGFAENTNCNATVTVLCTPPVAPIVTPSNVTTSTGQAVTFTVTNGVDSLLYTIMNASGFAYSKSLYGPAGGNLTIPSNTFNSSGTYNLMVVADKLYGASCSSSAPVTVQVNNIILPLKFINVSARRISDRNNEIGWKVSSEENVSYYLIERSYDCNNYTTVGTVNFQASSNAQNSYSFNDQTVDNGKKVCYRIKAVDKNGDVSISKIVSISESSKMTIQLSPNPANTSTTLYINSDKSQQTTIDIIDLSGRTVQTRTVQVEAGNNAITINDLKKLVKGQYIVKVNTTSEPYYLKLVIQ